MIFNNPTMNPTMTTAVNTTANANVREITMTTKILNPKTKEDGTITGLLLFSKATDYSQIAALQNAIESAKAMAWSTSGEKKCLQSCSTRSMTAMLKSQKATFSVADTT